ncbi:hypothetical protein [Pseudomonas aegrilactucae]|uniref:Uncharacterized protein n=1 Tax=Pseudomonas aegrilactucae TaxID=2854028 RepID=A0A9Q2XP89_9PSED|nr:hypothetical protein [Pseudomonas aegrilactucae]MBV6290293.1 hypothetical protein [Pseudomonas aegrilactucae]
MNPLTAALVQISPLHVRQLLFLCLALLLTLVAGQLYSIWQSKQIADQLSAQATQVAHIQATRASMLLQARTALRSQPANAATVETVVPRERWVF